MFGNYVHRNLPRIFHARTYRRVKIGYRTNEDYMRMFQVVHHRIINLLRINHSVSDEPKSPSALKWLNCSASAEGLTDCPPFIPTHHIKAVRDKYCLNPLGVEHLKKFRKSKLENETQTMNKMYMGYYMLGW